MKELSIEEKAARYDEAIQRANNIREGKCKNVFVYNHYNQGLIEYLFNELSEDERIRKELVGMVRLSCTNGDDADKKISWLEKQGKQKPTWGKEDEYILETLFIRLNNEQDNYPQQSCDFQEIQEFKNWLKSIKERLQPQPKQ